MRKQKKAAILLEDEVTAPGRKFPRKQMDPAEAPTRMQKDKDLPKPPVELSPRDTPADRTKEKRNNKLLKVHNAWNEVMSAYDLRHRDNPEIKKVLEDMQLEVAQNLENLVAKGQLPDDWAGGAGD